MKTYEFFNQMSYGQSMHNQQIISNFQLDLQTYYYKNELFFDNAKLDQKIQATKVLRFKDFKDWDFVILQELFEKDGVLWNQDRLEQYMERTKFFKRLLSFYMPSKDRFVKLPWKLENLIYARVGYLLLKTLLRFDIGKRNLIGQNFELYLAPGSLIVDSENPFHQKKSFIQDLEQYIEKEYMRFEKNNTALSMQRRQQLASGNEAAFGSGSQTERHKSSQLMAFDDDNQIGGGPKVFEVSKERFMSKQRLNQTMFREMISWIGLFTSQKETLQLISKKSQSSHSSSSSVDAQASGGNRKSNTASSTSAHAGQHPGSSSDRLSSNNAHAKSSAAKKKKDDNIFWYLRGLVDKDGYYDHLLQIVIHSFDFGINGSPARDLLREWSKDCSTNFAKSIIEAFRQLYRQGNLDFYSWCLPMLCTFLIHGDEEIKRSALSVLEEACFDEVSINFLLEAKHIQNLIKNQSEWIQRERFLLMQQEAEEAHLIAKGKLAHSLLQSDDFDIFICKFLRSEKGFKILKDSGWIDHKIHNWNQRGGVEYMMKLERNIYEGLSINQLNSLVKTHAMSIWIPIYEHSSDFRNEISTLKKFPF